MIEIDDVFDAMIAACGSSASIRLQELQLQVQVFGGRLDHEVGSAQHGLVRRAWMRLIAASLSSALSFSFFTSRSRLPVMVRVRAHGGFGDIHHHHLEPDRRAGLRDAVAHGSGADDADFFDLAHVILADG